MSDKPKDQVTTDERAAIRDEIVDEVTSELQQTPTPVGPSQSSEQVRRLARAEARPLIRTAVADHASECEHEGPLCSVAKKVDALRMSSYRQNGALALLTIVGPLALGIWLNSRANDRLTQQLKVAADVAAQLKAVQDAAKGHTMLVPDPPACQFATVLK